MDDETTPPALMLSYDFQTQPDPLQASPARGDLSTATLTAVVSNSTHRFIECTSITFSFPIGENAKDLSPDMTGVGVSPPDGWDISHDGGVFTATPKTVADAKIGRDGLAFFFSDVKVNRQPGRTHVIVAEATGSGNTASFPLAKFPPDFTVGDLNADPVQVNQGGSTTLTWSGSENATYTLKYGDNVITETADGKPLPATGSYTADNLQDNPTVFHLIVTQTLPGEDHPDEVQRHCPVTVLIPDVNIASFTASALSVNYKGSSLVSAKVNLTWEVTGAHQVLLNGDIVTGQQSTTLQTTETTMTLEATGPGGPVFAEIKLDAPGVLPALTVTPGGDEINLTFYAEAARNYEIGFSTVIRRDGSDQVFQQGMTWIPSTTGLLTISQAGPAHIRDGVFVGMDCTVQSWSGDSPPVSTFEVHYASPDL